MPLTLPVDPARSVRRCSSQQAYRTAVMSGPCGARAFRSSSMRAACIRRPPGVQRRLQSGGDRSVSCAEDHLRYRAAELRLHNALPGDSEDEQLEHLSHVGVAAVQHARAAARRPGLEWEGEARHVATTRVCELLFFNDPPGIYTDTPPRPNARPPARARPSHTTR